MERYVQDLASGGRISGSSSALQPYIRRTFENSVNRKFNFGEFTFHALGGIEMLLRRPDPPGGRLAPEARLLQIKVPLDAAHHFRADLARVAQGQEGFPLGREQLAPPLAPVPGALGVLLGRAASFETRRIALDVLLVVLTHPLLTLR